MSDQSIILICFSIAGGSLFIFVGTYLLSYFIHPFRVWIGKDHIWFYLLASLSFPSVLLMQIFGRGLYIISAFVRAASHLLLLHPWTALYELRDMKDWDVIAGRDA